MSQYDVSTAAGDPIGGFDDRAAAYEAAQAHANRYRESVVVSGWEGPSPDTHRAWPEAVTVYPEHPA